MNPYVKKMLDALWQRYGSYGGISRAIRRANGLDRGFGKGTIQPWYELGRSPHPASEEAITKAYKAMQQEPVQFAPADASSLKYRLNLEIGEEIWLVESRKPGPFADYFIYAGELASWKPCENSEESVVIETVGKRVFVESRAVIPSETVVGLVERVEDYINARY